MGKKKHKHDKHNAEQESRDRAGNAILLEQKKENAQEDGATKTSNPTNHGKSKVPPSWIVRLKEWVSRDKTFTDWMIGSCTLVIAVVAVLQSIILSNQVDNMRKDQRPWIRVWTEINPILTTHNVSGTYHLLNSGKTPAKSISAIFLIEKVRNGNAPTLESKNSYKFSTFTTGANFPHVPMDFPFTAYIISPPEFDDMQHAKFFFVMYGAATYTDSFHTPHWTNFCEIVALPGTYTGEKCTDYNNIDTN